MRLCQLRALGPVRGTMRNECSVDREIANFFYTWLENAPARHTKTKSAVRSATDWPTEGGPVVVCVAVVVAGGGGGGFYGAPGDSTAGNGGAGGGGDGGPRGSIGGNGLGGTGGGGGAASIGPTDPDSYPGGNGGSGIVLIAYPT